MTLQKTLKYGGGMLPSRSALEWLCWLAANSLPLLKELNEKPESSRKVGNLMSYALNYLGLNNIKSLPIDLS
jgi:hypothetical protein